MKKVLLVCSVKTEENTTDYDENEKEINDKISDILKGEKYEIICVKKDLNDKKIIIKDPITEFHNENVINFLKYNYQQNIYDLILFIGCNCPFWLVDSNYSCKVLYDYLSDDGYILSFEPSIKFSKFETFTLNKKRFFQIENLASIEIFKIFFRYSKTINGYAKRKISEKIKSTFYMLEGCNSISRYYNKKINNEVYIFESMDMKIYETGNLSHFFNSNFEEDKNIKVDFYLDLIENVPEYTEINFRLLNHKNINLFLLEELEMKNYENLPLMYKIQFEKFLSIFAGPNKKSIYYVNSLHAKLIKKFYETIQFKKIEYLEDYEHNNILLGNISQPLFSDGYYKDNIHISERCGNILLDFYNEKTKIYDCTFKELINKGDDFLIKNMKFFEILFPCNLFIVNYQLQIISENKNFVTDNLIFLTNRFIKIFNLKIGEKNFENKKLFVYYNYVFLTNLMNFLNSINLQKISEIIFLTICSYIQNPEIKNILGTYLIKDIYKTQNFIWEKIKNSNEIFN